MTLDEEFEKKFVKDWKLDFEGGYSELPKWFKSYIKSLMESVKLETNPYPDFKTFPFKKGYNQAISDQEAKIAQALKERGIL